MSKRVINNRLLWIGDVEAHKRDCLSLGVHVLGCFTDFHAFRFGKSGDGDNEVIGGFFRILIDNEIQ